MCHVRSQSAYYDVVVFPKDYEKYSGLLAEDAKIFVKGRISVEEEKDGKLICEQILAFEDAAQGGTFASGRYGQGGYGNNRSGGQGYGRNGSQNYSAGYSAQGNSNANAQAQPVKKLPEGVWIQFATVAEYEASERKLFDTIADSEGNDQVVIFIKESRNFKPLPPNRNVCADEQLRRKLSEVFGAENINFRIKPIENK